MLFKESESVFMPPAATRFHIRVYGHGAYIPPHVVTNEDLAQRLETSDEWIKTRTGIAQRHMASPQEHTSHLAIHSGLKSLAAAQLEPHDIDGIILATTTPDITFPATATLVQRSLGTQGFAFDVQAACGGFVLGMLTAAQWIHCGQARRILVIGAETMSRIVDWQDRSTAVLFGDGAGSVILEASPDTETYGFMGGLFGTDGSLADHLYVEGGVSKSQSAGFIRMQGREVFRHAVEKMTAISEQLLERYEKTIQDVDWVIPHQANLRIIENIGQRLGCEKEKVIVTVDQHANTSAASIPLALEYAVRSQKLQKGHLVLCPALGAGFAWGAVLFHWGG